MTAPTQRRRPVVDHIAEAVAAALTIGPRRRHPLPASGVPTVWISSEYPRPVPAPQAAPQTPAGIRPADSPTHSTVVGRPVVGTNQAANIAAGK